MSTDKPLERDDYTTNDMPNFHALYIPIFSIGLILSFAGYFLWLVPSV